jgi:virginiamycin A acetyltransferase
MSALASRIGALARDPGRAACLALFSLSRNWSSMFGVSLRRLVLPRLFAPGGPGLSVGAGALVVGFDRIRIGANVNVMSGVSLLAAGDGAITIGDECSINDNVQFGAGPRGAISLGDAVLLGANVVLRNCNHRWRDPTRRIRDQGHDCADIVIEDDVWIGANTVVLGGAYIRRGSVIAAGSVVRPGDYGPMELFAGNPAVRIGARSGEGPLG